MRPLRWWVCLIVRHSLVGPSAIYARDEEYNEHPFFGWHCSRCLMRVMATKQDASLPMRGGFRVMLRSLWSEPRWWAEAKRLAMRRRCA